MKKNNNIKELICYAIIVVILLTISILNKNFWKIGIKENKQEDITNSKNVQFLEVNNITYNVPFNEEWLD